MNFLKKIFSPTILTISFLLLFYTFYKSEIIWNGDNRNYYKTYYLVSSILICFSIITFFINQKIKEYLVIIIISFISTLYLFQGYLTFYPKIKNEMAYKKETKKKWDRRTKKEIYNDFSASNDNVSLAIPLNAYLDNTKPIFPFGGASFSKAINCNENGYYSIINTDRYGFNNPDDEWNIYDIEYFLVGDSYVQGDCVNMPNDMASVLRTITSKSILNLGMRGSGTLSQYAVIREYLNPNMKKILFFFYEGNDLSDLKSQKQNKILMRYVNDKNFSQNLKLRQSEIDDYVDDIINLEIENLEKSHYYLKDFFSFIRLFDLRFLIKKKDYTQPKPDLFFKQILMLTKELIDNNNSKLYFIYLPEYARYNQKYNNDSYNLVKKIVTDLKIEFIDIHEELFLKEKNHMEIFSIAHPHHYSVAGYKKVAEIIYEFTKD